MATYDFSTLIANGNDSQAFSTADILTFNDDIHASDLIIATVGADITLRLSTGFTLTLSNFSQDKIASANFKFADGSKLIMGDGLATTLNDNSANSLIGTEFSDYLDGGLGNDTVSYAAASSGVSVDLSKTTAQDTFGAGVDKLLGIENIIGSIYSDILVGDEEANSLDGGAGIDVMDGKNGADTYYVTAGDLATDTGASGTDEVYAAVDYVLGAGIENLVLTGTGSVSGRGNSLNNTLMGNSGNNLLDGVDAATTGTGTDTLKGLGGNDTYYIHSTTDMIEETTTGGSDTVISKANFDMNTRAINVESMRLVGAAISGNGNSLANTIYGNSKNNVLSGDAGDDILADLLGGADILIGGSGADNLKGGSGADILIGGTAVGTTANTSGDSKVDTLVGGTGNDTYYVTDAVDVVNELANAGVDIVNASISYALNDASSIGVENLTLLVSTDINGTGNSLANTLIGNDGDNTLIGGKGADSLAGGIGDDILTGGADALTSDGAADSLTGGAGNDSYNVTDASDVVHEAASAGTNDIVNSTVTYALNDTNSVGVEKLTLTGLGNITATGNSLANTITGNKGNNTLNGGAGSAIDTLIDTLGGNDILNGGAGADVMSGGLGADTYIVDNASDSVTEAPLQGTDLVEASVTYTLTDVDVENLTLTGTDDIDGTGNASANTLVGNNGANTLKGGDNADYLKGGNGNDLLIGGSRDTGSITADGTPDADTMEGGAGNDTYSVDNVFDVIIETSVTGSGTDLVKSRVSYVIGLNVENLTLTGETGVVSNADAINGTGNDSANTLIGNAGKNTLSGLAGADTLTGNAGHDTLDGGIGADEMSGGLGNDTYIVDANTGAGPSASTGDTVIEASGEGTDLVNASVTYTISDVDVENLTLTGANAINGTGNASANILIGNGAVNILTGLDGNDSLDGKVGADTLRGGNGNDSYYVDDISDVVDETTGTTGGDANTATVVNAALDTVYANVNYTIADAKVENLTLIGAGTITGTGNSSANILTGNTKTNTLNGADGADQLNGGAGKDTLTGGEGNDTFVFTLSSDSSLTLFDVITDFNSGADKINLTAIDTGTLVFGGSQSGSPVVVSGAHRVDYYSTGGNTFVIADTDGVANTIDFKVQLTGYGSSLSSSDFNL